MTKRSLTVTFILSVLLVLLCHVASTGQEPSGYVVTAAGEKVTFIARPELAYVLKTQQNTFNTETFSGMLQQFSDAEIKPIRGLGRKGISVVAWVFYYRYYLVGPRRTQYGRDYAKEDLSFPKEYLSSHAYERERSVSFASRSSDTSAQHTHSA